MRFVGLALPRRAAPVLAGLLFATLSLLAAPAQAREGLELLMFNRAGCEWCALWEKEVGVVYDRTDEARQAPLTRTNLFKPAPEGVTLKSGVRFTPTFVLLLDGAELGRIEGYPGEDFFWSMLDRLLENAGAPTKEAEAGPPGEKS